MPPFAENSIPLVSEIDCGLNQNNTVYLRHYIIDPLVPAFKDHWEHKRTVLRGIAAYWLAPVTSFKSNL